MTERTKRLSEDERRSRGRRHVNSLAWADPGGVLRVIDCRILDLSEGGARVTSTKGVEMPDLFQLQIDSSRILGPAEVVWREREQVGVRFLRKP